MSDQNEVRKTNATTGGEKGQKLDRFDLIPAESLRQIAHHFGVGAKKYADRNWEKGYEWDLSYGALQRHLNAWWGGEDIDEETGSSHLAAAGFHVLALLEFERTHPELDTRPTTVAAKAEIEELLGVLKGSVYIAPPDGPKVGDVLEGGKDGLRSLPIGTVIEWQGHLAATKVSKKKWYGYGDGPEKDTGFLAGWVIKSLPEPEPLTGWDDLGYLAEPNTLWPTPASSSAHTHSMIIDMGDVTEDFTRLFFGNVEVESTEDGFEFTAKPVPFVAERQPGEFRVGDRVRHGWLSAPGTGTVAGFLPDGMPDVLWDPENFAVGGERHGALPHNLTLLDEQPLEPKYHVGDRVSVRDIMGALDGAQMELREGGINSPVNGVVRFGGPGLHPDTIVFLDALEDAGFQVTKA